ncbi:MAG: hypothetical protein WCE64_04020, partial [Bacteroidales bacterium]
MKNLLFRKTALASALFVLSALAALPQMSPEVYREADDLVKMTTGKVYYGSVRPSWVGKTGLFLYENFTPSGTDYVLVNPTKLTKTSPFDQKKFALAFEAATGTRATPGKLPIRNLVFSERLGSFAFTYENYNWICNLKNYRITKGDEVAERIRRGAWDWGFRDELTGDPVES